MTKTAEGSPAPRVLFISHRQVDKPIADALTQWIDDLNLDPPIEIFQSTRPGRGAGSGYRLDAELRRGLKRANVVICLYTVHDSDWSYCMWECGLAEDPVEPSTHVIMLQFTDRYAAPFQDRVRVDVRDPDSVLAFVTEFLTRPDYFPGSGGPVLPNVDPEGGTVTRQAAKLQEKLEALAPRESREWRPWPVLVLQFPADEIDDFVAERFTSEEEQTREMRHLLDNHCVVVDGDRTAPSLFGKHFEPRTPFKAVTEAWRSRSRPSSNFDWLDSVARQISLAARDEMPDTEWVVMEGGPGIASQWSTPVLCWTRRNNSKGWVQFDIYFIPAKPPGSFGYAPVAAQKARPHGPLNPSEAAVEWEANVDARDENS